MADRRLLAVFAHPDDETFRCGGTLALPARRGVRVRVLCATRGEADVPPFFEILPARHHRVGDVGQADDGLSDGGSQGQKRRRLHLHRDDAFLPSSRDQRSGPAERGIRRPGSSRMDGDPLLRHPPRDGRHQGRRSDRKPPRRKVRVRACVHARVCMRIDLTYDKV